METAEDFSWALFLVRRLLAFQILLGWGRYEGRNPLSIGDRIPLRNPIDGDHSELTWLLVAPPSNYPAEFHLPTGRAEFPHLVGITETEAAFARNNGYESLLRGGFLVAPSNSSTERTQWFHVEIVVER